MTQAALDLLVTNGCVLTMDSAGRTTAHEAVGHADEFEHARAAPQAAGGHRASTRSWLFRSGRCPSSPR
jgi:hypothetical protein